MPSMFLSFTQTTSPVEAEGMWACESEEGTKMKKEEKEKKEKNVYKEE